MLVMGSGTAWAGFSYNWGTSVGTWDFTSGVNISDFTGSGWTAGNGTNPSRAYKVYDGLQTGATWGTLAGLDQGHWGFDHLRFNGTITVFNTGQGLLVPGGATIGIDVYPGYVVSITASTHQVVNGQDRGNDVTCTFENVVSAPEAPTFGQQSKTIDVVYSGTSQGYITMYNPGGHYRDLYITKIVMSPKPTMYWVKNNTQTTFDKINLTDLDYNEPTIQMSFIPEGANVWLTVTSDDGAIGLNGTPTCTNTSITYDLMALKPGGGTVTAHAAWNGGYVEASYRVQVDADEYTWDTEGTYKYYVTGAGAILNPVVDAVPYMTMTYGNPDNVSMVRDRDGNLVTTIIDQWGWRHARLWYNNGGTNYLPWQGTFYKFEPQIDGDLTIWMRLETGKAVLVDETALTTAVKMFESKGSNIAQYETVHLQGGHTYYLYGIVQEQYVPQNFRQNYGNIWAVAELNGFKFEPNGGLIYGYKGLVYKDGKLYNIKNEKIYDTPKQPIGGPAETVQYSLEFYPNAEEGPSATIASDGTLTIDETRGGAIAVKAIIYRNGQEVNRDYYIVTVPYKTHDWWFTESVNPKELVEDRPAAHKQDFTTWSLAYKVLRPVMRTVTIDGQSQTLRLRREVKDPVLCSSKPIQGNNAGYVVQTAGLLFDAKAQRFGVNTDLDYSDIKEYENGHVKTVEVGGIPYDVYLYDFDNNDQDALTLDRLIGNYAYNKTPQDTYGYPTNLVTMATESSFTIPYLEEGQYIRIYWRRHNKQKGDLYKATGVRDLTGADMDGTGVFYAGNGNGYTEFIAKGGNATFTLQREGDPTLWTDIYRITVGEVGEFLETGLSPRVGNIMYNPRPPMPQAITETDGTITYMDHTSYNYTGTGTMAAWGPRSQFNVPYESIVTDNGAATTQTVSVRGGTGGNNMSASYKVVGNVGTGTCTVSGDQVTFQGTGIAAIVCNYKSGDFVVDTDTLTMAYGTVDFQDYPHTWDFTMIGRNTDTKDMLANDYSNGTGIDWYKKNDWGDPNTADESEYKIWQPVENEDNVYQLNGYHKEIKGVMFANGAQLTAGFEPIEETKGLGIYLRKGKSGSYFIYSMADDSEESFSGRDMLRYGIDDDGETAAGYLQFADVPEGSVRRYIIRVPQVSKSAGQRVYICADGEPAAYQEPYANNNNGSNSDITTLTTNTDGNTSYFIPENDGDVFIDVTGMKVFKIGVTSTFKKLNDYQGKSYATESREHNVKYDLSGYFTGKEVQAFKVTSYAKADDPNATIEDSDPANAGIPMVGNLTLEPVDVSDAGTGVILVGTSTGFTSEPLFVKDVNSNLDNTAGNMMVASTTSSGGTASVPSNPYILTRTYRLLDENGQPTGDKKTGPLAFYKMFSGSLSAHLAYFSMPEESSNYYTFRFIDEMDEEEGFGADGIEQIAIEDLADTEDAVYYNINGQKLNGIPTQKGIYICNGKKFYVK